MKVVGQSRRPASPASEVAEAGTILVGSAVHCDGCQHKRVTKTLHFTPFQEVRRGLSCSKQHQLIIDGEREAISTMELSLVPLLYPLLLPPGSLHSDAQQAELFSTFTVLYSFYYIFAVSDVCHNRQVIRKLR